jgi:hypothetical protein
MQDLSVNQQTLQKNISPFLDNSLQKLRKEPRKGNKNTLDLDHQLGNSALHLPFEYINKEMKINWN